MSSANDSPQSEHAGNHVRAREGELVGAADSAEQVRARERDSGVHHKRKLTRQQRKFIAAYAVCGTVTQAAEAADVIRQKHYRWLKNPVYAKAFADCYEEACESLEREARRRAIDGWDEPVYQGGELVGTKRRFSDALLIFLMKGAMPDKYRDNIRVEHGDRSVAVTFDADWYGNNAHDRIAEASAAPTSDSAE